MSEARTRAAKARALRERTALLAGVVVLTGLLILAGVQIRVAKEEKRAAEGFERLFNKVAELIVRLLSLCHQFLADRQNEILNHNNYYLFCALKNGSVRDLLAGFAIRLHSLGIDLPSLLALAEA